MTEHTSFISALKAKYCDNDDDNNLECETFGVQITVFGRGGRHRSGSPRRDSASEPGDRLGGDGGEKGAELEYLKNIVLSNQSISHAAVPSNGLTSLCPNVCDLDLSVNLLRSWGEVLTIFKHLPNLKFCNLSSNPLEGSEINDKLDFSCSINDLVLNNTKVSWSEVMALARILPKLQQLHLCMNEYSGISVPEEELSDSLSELHKLSLNNNRIRSWDEVAKLRSLPKLKTLILLENPLQDLYHHKRTHSASVGDNAAEDNPTEPSSAMPEECSHEDAGNGGRADVRPSGDEVKGQPVPDGRRQEVTCGDDSKVDPGYMASETVKAEGLAHCPIDLSPSVRRIPSDKQQANSLSGFRTLEALCLTRTALSSWQHLHELRNFPNLHSVKIKNIQLLEALDPTEKRKLAVACLPSIKFLNGSEVTAEERDKSERHFVRTFSNHADPPARYQELVQTHGELKPFSKVRLGKGFQEFVKLKFIYEGKCIKEDVMRVLDPIKKLRLYCAQLIKKPAMFLILYHKTNGALDDEVILQDLNLELMPMSRFDMKDGDEVHISISQPSTYYNRVPSKFKKSFIPSER